MAPQTTQHIRFRRRFLALSGDYWRGERRWQVRALTLALALLTIAQVLLAVRTNYWQRELFDALQARSLSRFAAQIGVFAVIVAATLVVTALHLHVKRWLQLDWRDWLTTRLMERWMAQGRHFQLSFTPGEHDNPDGRIADDIRIVTETAIALGHTLFYSVLMLGTFIRILWQTTGGMTVPGTAVVVPGYMVMLAFGYAGVGAALGWSLGRPLVRATNALQTAEARFRFALAHQREHSESIALLKGEHNERRTAAGFFRAIAQGWTRQSLAYTWIVAYSNAYGALLPVFPILVMAPQLIAGSITLGVLMQSAQAFEKLTSALSWPVDHLGEMALWRASADRVLSLYESIQAMDRRGAAPDGNRITIGESDRPRMVFRNLCIASPDGRIMLESFNASIRRGERVLIHGDSAVTSALFKVIAGLWPWGRGKVFMPDDRNLLFMPQHPYLPEGTLRAALCYPDAESQFGDEQIRRALECAGIAWLGGRLDESDSWDGVLPQRSRQRLGIARLLLRRPSWILMQEATNAFDPRSEAQVYEMLRRELPNATLITISSHTHLAEHHGRRLQICRLLAERWLHPRNGNGNGTHDATVAATAGSPAATAPAEET